MRHIPNLKDLSTEEIKDVLHRAATIKANPKEYSQLLAGESLAMVFQKTSTRTRVSFEVAMTELGGHAIYIDCIMARLIHHSDLEKIISASQVPVINGCCEKFHPCQALTDILTVSEHYDGELSSAHIVFVGVQNNVSNSLAVICSKLGIQLSLATPETDDNSESVDAEIQSIISSSAHIQHVTDPKEVIGSADFVYTDTWIDMQYFNNPDFNSEKDALVKQMASYQINEALVKGVDCKIMHDMPIHDGYEITPEMVRDPRSIIFQQAENRLHAQKGLLWWLYDQAGMIST
jgi:ornithine carbamoyltransferase